LTALSAFAGVLGLAGVEWIFIMAAHMCFRLVTKILLITNWHFSYC